MESTANALPLFIANQLVFFSYLYVVFFASGCAVAYAGLRPNYARKLVSFAFFGGSYVIDGYFPRIWDTYHLWGTLCILLFFLTFSERVSQHSGFLRLCFRGFARPEDYPYTLRWVLCEFITLFFVMHLCMLLMALFHLPGPFIMLPILIGAFADGLAEPVGIRFGKHPYTTRALFTQRRYVRSVQGSLTVFFVSMALVGCYASYFSPLQLACAGLLIPATVMLAEAFSPHTFDAPAIYLTSTLALIAVGYI